MEAALCFLVLDKGRIAVETDLLAEKMRQAAEVLEKLAAMGVTSVNIESIKETPPASSADPKPPAVDPKTPTTKPADKEKDPPAIKPETTETKQGTPATEQEAPVAEPADKDEEPSDIKPGTPETEQGTPATEQEAPAAEPADKDEEPSDIKPGTPETEQGTPAQDGQESIESTITGTRITFKMPKPKEETRLKTCSIFFVGIVVGFLVAIFLYLLFLRGWSTSPTPGSHSFRQTLTTSLETHEVRVPEGK